MAAAWSARGADVVYAWPAAAGPFADSDPGFETRPLDDPDALGGLIGERRPATLEIGRAHV